MKTKFFSNKEIKFANVKIATFITGKDTDTVSICLLDIAPKTEIPIHNERPVRRPGECYNTMDVP